MRTGGSTPTEERVTQLADAGVTEEVHHGENDGIAV